MLLAWEAAGDVCLPGTLGQALLALLPAHVVPPGSKDFVASGLDSADSRLRVLGGRDRLMQSQGTVLVHQ